MRKVDYIIVGFGLAGALISWKLIKRGFSVLVFDNGNSASSVAAGLINPITGRAYNKSWKFDILRKQLLNDYREIESEYDISILHSINIFRKLNNPGEENKWSSRIGSEGYEDYMMPPEDLAKEDQAWLQNSENLAGIKNGFRLNINLLLNTLRLDIKRKDQLEIRPFLYDQVDIKNKIYQDVHFDKIIFCEGVGVLKNPFFQSIKIVPNKGEVAILQTIDQPSTTAYKASRFLIPIEDNKYWVGSTYDTKDASLDPSPHLKDELTKDGERMAKLDFSFVDHLVGLRPTTMDRMPILGKHPSIADLYLFNGMGTKGSSLSPYFSEQLIEYILNDQALDPEVRIERYH